MEKPLIPRGNLEDLARKFGLGEYARAPDANDHADDSPSGEQSLVQEGENYVFLHLPYQGKTISRVALTPLLENGSNKTHDGWREYAANNQDGVSIPNTLLWYQMLRQLYVLHDNEECKEVVESCVAALCSEFDRLYLHTGTKVAYGSGLSTEINHLELGADPLLTSLDIPEFTKVNDQWCYLTLTPQQPVSALGNVSSLSTEGAQVVKSFFGEGYQEAGAVFQYVASRKDNGQNLREVRLWLPMTENRNTERAVVLGVDNGNDGFGIDASDVLGSVGPARGVVVVEEAP